jgi:hypothetical protein
VEARVGKVRARGQESPLPNGNAVPRVAGRAIPRSAWQKV